MFVHILYLQVHEKKIEFFRRRIYSAIFTFINIVWYSFKYFKHILVQTQIIVDGIMNYDGSK